jgi:hypothetical protein
VARENPTVRKSYPPTRRRSGVDEAGGPRRGVPIAGSASGSRRKLRHSVRRRTSDLGVVNRCLRSGANRVNDPVADLQIWRFSRSPPPRDRPCPSPLQPPLNVSRVGHWAAQRAPPPAEEDRVLLQVVTHRFLVLLDSAVDVIAARRPHAWHGPSGSMAVSHHRAAHRSSSHIDTLARSHIHQRGSQENALTTAGRYRTSSTASSNGASALTGSSFTAPVCCERPCQATAYCPALERLRAAGLRRTVGHHGRRSSTSVCGSTRQR